MIGIRNALYLIFLFIFTSSDPFFGSSSLLFFQPGQDNESFKELTWDRSLHSDIFLNDIKNRVSPDFKINPFFYNSVKFWFSIYTIFDSNQIILHDKDNLSLIYTILDFNSLKNKKLPKFTEYFLIQKLSNEKAKSFKNQLEALSKNPDDQSPQSLKIINSLKLSNVSLPDSGKEKSVFFTQLAQNIRTQSGQKNFIRDGINRSLPFENFLEYYFYKKNLPRELLAIPFLESSFNPVAQSKVNALGAWQFMPFIAKYFVPKRKDGIDYRRSIGVSSISAAFLMKQNFNILKRWDLAVTAYNSGTKNILHTKKQLKLPNLSLVDIIQNSNSKSFGFASKNFYSEFLALVHTLAYRDEIFDLLPKSKDFKENDFHFYLSKCDLTLGKVLSPYEIKEIDFYNHHFFDFNKKFHRGLIISSKLPLSNKYFHQLNFDQILKFKPIDWPKLLKSYNCSTR